MRKIFAGLLLSSMALVPVVTERAGADELTTGFDPAVWDLDNATSGLRFCQDAVNGFVGVWQPTTSPCHGAVDAGPLGSMTTTAGGTVQLTRNGGRAYPFVITRDGAIPATGDFVVEVRARFTELEAHGTGFAVLPLADGDFAAGETQPANLPPGPERCGRFSFNANSTVGASYRLGESERPLGVPTGWHTYRLQYTGGKYLLFLDGATTPAIGPVATGHRATHAWVGNHAFAWWGAGDWTDMELDYVRITSPTGTDHDGDGVYDGVQAWPANPNNPDDSDGDLIPDLCDDGNRPPVIDAGPDQEVDEGETVTLQPSGHDPDGDPITGQWVQVSGPPVTLSDPQAAFPTFTAPAGPATLVFEAQAFDGQGHAVTDRVTITVRPPNRPPVVDAGVDQEVAPDSVATLSGTASDPDDDPLTYAWTQVGGPPAVIRDPDDPETVVEGFEAGATLTFRLTVTDARGASSSGEVVVTVKPK
jgi:hypothetical protein